MKTILLTGATGAIGRKAWKVLEVEGFKVIPLFHGEFDLTRPLGNLPKSAHFCVHTAAATPNRNVSKRDFFSTNAEGTKRLVRALERDCPKLEKLVIVSTGAVYGSSPKFRSESDVPKPNATDFYAQSKLMGEEAGVDALRRGSFSVTVLRVFFPYGNVGSPARLVPRLIQKVKFGEPVLENKGGGPRIQLIHVSDVVDSIVRSVMVSPLPLYMNISGDEVTTIRKLASRIGDLIGRKPVFKVNDPPSGEFLADNAVAKSVLGWIPKVGLNEGLKNLMSQPHGDKMPRGQAAVRE